MDWGPDLGAVLLLLLTWAGLVASLAILLGNLARTEGQAIGLGVISANVLAALGGCWWPIEITPDWMQRLALFLPTGWAMDAMHQLAIFQNGAASALPHVAGMLLAGLLFGALAARRFRFQ
jgi:ABC-type multidrug transport system permease subunit